MIEQIKDEEGAADSQWDAALQASIDRGLKQIQNGETIPHEEIKKRYAQWLE